VIGKPTRPDADVDFTFAQLSVKEAITRKGTQRGTAL